jgi:hypothetical protein
MVASLDRKRLGRGVLWKAKNYIRGVFDKETRRKPLAFASDGSVWLLGASYSSSPSLRDAPDHFFVKHVGPDGELKGEYLLRSTIPCAAHPAAGGLAKILVSDDRIGLFLYSCDYWVELKPNGDLIGKWHWSRKVPGGSGKPDVERRVEHVVLSHDKEIYATIEEQSGYSVTAGLFRLDRTKSDWIPVNTVAIKQVSAPIVSVQGTEGDKLVYISTGGRVAWAKVTANAP